MGVDVAVGVGVLVGVRVGMAVVVGVLVGIAVADGVRVGESVGVDDGVLVGAGVKVGIGALIGDGVLSVPKKQAEATGSVRHAMRITYGRRFMALPRLVQGVDGHDVERMRRTALQTSAMRCMSCLHIESPLVREAVTGSRRGNGITFAQTPTRSRPRFRVLLRHMFK